ncbi:RtcB family protein [Thermotoga sp. KOL6]|uniref:RtcB family protein n=1 Tax=Thermotoga sp. KOL6 TaxID=126741 RepID=UPI000C770E13|nr:RtcB family protein [Thermotoga sp. KOL6]PLV60009.1 tRNA-splicing ligase [Thermotoga sp. KOL6]
MNVVRVDKYVWKIPKEGKMKVDAFVFTDSESVNDPQFREAMKQLVNVATLPGIVKYALAMPDIHWGYGFPIGGVAAFDVKEGIISPGGVGFDINCGVRLMITDLRYEDVRDKMRKLVETIYEFVPAGVGSTGDIVLGKKSLRKVLVEGAVWAVKAGYGLDEDLEKIEDYGRIQPADPNYVSEEAFERGGDELGTLGAGNHFIEVQMVEEVYDEELARSFGLEVGSVTVMIHSGSRGFGHQVATDYIRLMRDKLKEHNKDLPDKQLINAPFEHPLGQAYYSAMNCAANYAFANREIIGHLVRKAFWKVFGRETNLSLIYDVAHNIAKLEEYEIDGKRMKLVVHRKGATRSLGPGNEKIPEAYREIGQPVIIPGDMGTASYLLVGTRKAEEKTFGSTAHGAGRMLGRSAALKRWSYREVLSALEGKNIVVMSKSKKTLVEEAPEAYKDVDRVVHIVHELGISRKVARMVPVGVVKG